MWRHELAVNVGQETIALFSDPHDPDPLKLNPLHPLTRTYDFYYLSTDYLYYLTCICVKLNPTTRPAPPVSPSMPILIDVFLISWKGIDRGWMCGSGNWYPFMKICTVGA